MTNLQENNIQEETRVGYAAVAMLEEILLERIQPNRPDLHSELHQDTEIWLQKRPSKTIQTINILKRLENQSYHQSIGTQRSDD